MWSCLWLHAHSSIVHIQEVCESLKGCMPWTRGWPRKCLGRSNIKKAFQCGIKMANAYKRMVRILEGRRVHTFYFFLFALCPRSHGIQQRWPLMHNGNTFDRNLLTILLPQLHIWLDWGIHACCSGIACILEGTMGGIPRSKWLYLGTCCK